MGKVTQCTALQQSALMQSREAAEKLQIQSLLSGAALLAVS